MSISRRLHMQQSKWERAESRPLLFGKLTLQTYSHAKKAHFHEKIQLPFYCLINEYELLTHVSHLSIIDYSYEFYSS